MAVKTGKFLTFNDGTAAIYDLVNEAEKGDRPLYKLRLKEKLRFSYNTVGMQRFYEAMQAQVNISLAVLMPMRTTVSTQDVVIIEGRQYRIIQKQDKYDTRPASMLLTLSDIEEAYDVR